MVLVIPKSSARCQNKESEKKRGKTSGMASWFSCRCLSSVRGLTWQVSVLSSQPKSFKGGPCEFINRLSCVYFTEYIIHSGTSFTLLIQGHLFFLWVCPDKVILLEALSKQTNTSWIYFFGIFLGRMWKMTRTALEQNTIIEHDLVFNGSTSVNNVINKKEIRSTPFPFSWQVEACQSIFMLRDAKHLVHL